MNRVLLGCLAMMVSTCAFATPTLWLKPQPITSIQVSLGDESAGIYFRTSGTWETTAPSDCATPTYAMFKNQRAGAQELLSIALAAKTLGNPVTLVGVCGYHEAYFEVQRIIY